MKDFQIKFYSLLFIFASIFFIGCVPHARLMFKSQPTGAKIYNDKGEFIGVTPTDYFVVGTISDEALNDGEWAPGITYIAHLDGYKEERWYCRLTFNPQEVKTNVKTTDNGGFYTYTFNLKAIQQMYIEEPPKVQIQQQQQQQQQNVIIGSPDDANGSVLITTNPEFVDLYVDGLFVGNAPATFKLKEGVHIIEAKAKGFIDYKKEIRILSSSELRLKIELEKK